MRAVMSPALSGCVWLKIRVRGGEACTGHSHHPAIDFDAIAVRIQKIKGVATAAAKESPLAALRRVHKRTIDQFDSAGTHMADGVQPIFSRVHLERDVIEAGLFAPRGVGRVEVDLRCVSCKLEQHDIVVLRAETHEAIGRRISGGPQRPVTLKPSTFR
jgi:hypothetical protein